MCIFYDRIYNFFLNKILWHLLCFSAGTRRTNETSERVPTAPFGLLSAQNNGSWSHRGWTLSKHSQRERQAHTPDRPPVRHRTHTHPVHSHTLPERQFSIFSQPDGPVFGLWEETRRKAMRTGREHVESNSIYLFIDLIIKSIYFSNIFMPPSDLHVFSECDEDHLQVWKVLRRCLWNYSWSNSSSWRVTINRGSWVVKCSLHSASFCTFKTSRSQTSAYLSTVHVMGSALARVEFARYKSE